MLQQTKNFAFPKTQIVGTLKDWNSRSDLLKFSGLSEDYIVYEIAFGNKLFFHFLSMLNSTKTGVTVVTHASDIENELNSKFIAYDLPNIRPIYIHITTTYNDKTFHIILADHMMYPAGKISPFIFVCMSKTEGDINDVLDYINATKKSEQYNSVNKKIFVYTAKPLSPFEANWDICNPIQYRNIDTVYIEAKVKNDLIGDIRKFLSDQSEVLYKNTGIPFKRCFLFYGLPGTGKTSLVRAMASLFCKNICILKLKSQFLNDHSLYNLAQTIPSDSILLIDDIDSAFSSDNNPMCERVSLAGLLDLLDGISSYNKQLIFITCNQTNVFNKILMRPGRIDKIIEFGAMSAESAKLMLEKFCLSEQPAKIEKLAGLIDTIGKITPAELQSILLENNCSLDILLKKFEKIHSDMANQYAALSTKCTQLYQNHYGDLYGYGNSLYL